MECVCAPTAKDTVIVLSEFEGTSTLEGFVQVEHDGSNESCSLRNPLQEFLRAAATVERRRCC